MDHHKIKKINKNQISEDIMEQMPLAIQVFAPDGQSISANKAWELLWGESRDYLSDYNILKDPQFINSPLFKNYLKAFEKGEVIYAGEFFYDPSKINKPGRSRWLDINLYPIKDKDGKVLEVVQTLDDITDTKDAKTMRDRFKIMIENSTDFISIATVNEEIIYLNEAGKKIIGLSEDDDVTSMEIKDFHPDWAYKALKEDAIPKLMKGEVALGETALLRADGHEVPVFASGVINKLPNGEIDFIGIIARDMTEIKKINDELKNKIKQSEKTNKYMVDRELRMIDLKEQLKKKNKEN
ncbi:PAS domain S-box protein [Candidatus Wolfebacteria bacterium]|nr:PAS domain S-box protein [Candidatus Wolfebacteria bacterium]